MRKNLEICLGGCPNLGPVVDGRFTCKLSGATAKSHADKGECPENRFTERPPLLAGDIVESLAKRFGADRVAKLTAKLTGKLTGKKDCGCAGRKAALNQPDLLVNRALTRLQRLLRS